ncbi:MAG: cyclic nucleotide-binding domain-containing protein [Alphaproteobacteria bacterium]|nr:cyclic nucleotide-binding domain-containing protein [Alphaproteobacteria bacterium]
MGKKTETEKHNDLDPRKGLNPRDQRVLNREVYYKGQNIVSQGDDGYRAYYIEKGRVEVLVKEDGHQLKVTEMGAGDIFGEMALITREGRSATVRALEETTLTVISRDEVEGKIGNIRDPAIRALINVLAERLRSTTKGQMTHYKSLAEFQDRVTGIVDAVHDGIDAKNRDAFRNEVTPLLEDLQKVLDRYHRP